MQSTKHSEAGGNIGTCRERTVSRKAIEKLLEGFKEWPLSAVFLTRPAKTLTMTVYGSLIAIICGFGRTSWG